MNANIEIRTQRQFDPAQLQQLFESVGWQSARYAGRLSRALQNGGAVFSAWDGERLVGLASALDDGELIAYLHYLLVDPAYQGQGLGRRLLERMKAHYRGYYYLLLSAENRDTIPFYEKLGFAAREESTVMRIITE